MSLDRHVVNKNDVTMAPKRRSKRARDEEDSDERYARSTSIAALMHKHQQYVESWSGGGSSASVTGRNMEMTISTATSQPISRSQRVERTHAMSSERVKNSTPEPSAIEIAEEEEGPMPVPMNRATPSVSDGVVFVDEKAPPAMDGFTGQLVNTNSRHITHSDAYPGFLTANGLTEYDVPSDGHCGYHSLALGCGLVERQDNPMRAPRGQVVENSWVPRANELRAAVRKVLESNFGQEFSKKVISNRKDISNEELTDKIKMDTSGHVWLRDTYFRPLAVHLRRPIINVRDGTNSRLPTKYTVYSPVATYGHLNIPDASRRSGHVVYEGGVTSTTDETNILLDTIYRDMPEAENPVYVRLVHGNHWRVLLPPSE